MPLARDFEANDVAEIDIVLVFKRQKNDLLWEGVEREIEPLWPNVQAVIKIIVSHYSYMQAVTSFSLFSHIPVGEV